MVDKTDLESAIMDAEGAAAVLEILEEKLTSSTTAGWEALEMKPRDYLRVTALSPTADRALRYAGLSLRSAVAEVSRIFYAAVEEGRL